MAYLTKNKALAYLAGAGLALLLLQGGCTGKDSRSVVEKVTEQRNANYHELEAFEDSFSRSRSAPKTNQYGMVKPSYKSN